MALLAPPPQPPAPTLPAPPARADLVRGIPWLLAGHLLNTIFLLWTFGGAVFLLFLDELGLPKGQMGGLLSLFPFAHLLALAVAPLATRWGWKRVFLLAYGLRKWVMATLVLLPWLLAWWGPGAAVWVLFGVIIVFALLRAVAETAFYPWSQEFVPNDLRGRYNGLTQVFTTAGAGLAIVVASVVLAGDGVGLRHYLWLIGGGCLCGFLGVLAMLPVAGGAPRPADRDYARHRADLGLAARDRNFRAYLLAVGCVTIGGALLLTFLPLFVKEHLGLPPGRVVALELALMLGAAGAAWPLGGAADRVGSRPILLCSLAANLLVPLAWLLLPRTLTHPLPICALLYAAQGAAAGGVAIGAGRLLFNAVIPPAHSAAYSAVFYAWIGLTGGCAPLLAGHLLHASASWRVVVLAGVTLDGFSVLFAAATLLLAAGWLAFARVAPDHPQRTRVVLRQVLETTLRRLTILNWR